MKQTTRLDHEERIAAAVGYILRHPEDHLDLRRIADEVGVSRFHFHRIFQTLLGETVAEMVRRLRLERAAHRLRTGDTPITVLAFEAGYATHEAFIRAFRSAYGCTPSSFRRQVRYEGRLPTPNRVHFDDPGGLCFLQPKGEWTMKINIQEFPTRKAVCLAHHGAYFMIGQTFERLMSLIGTKGIPMNQTVALYYDDPENTPVEELRSDAGVFVADDFTSTDPDVRVVMIEGGSYAVATHMGPYDGLGHAWAEFTRGVTGTGYSFRNAPSFEVYVNDCREVPPEQVRTDLYVPVAKAG
ncbi:MAG: GyrI-like domain-containing protein [Capsulimonadales bacterium]|nr:GyrI-like domain-containing protein [Capsulimonadales bacterium]